MTGQDVEQLRAQLRTLGYLSRGIERWFVLDPWSSRTFWAELLLITAKAAAIAAPFAALPAVAVMFIRNGPLPLYDALLLMLTYLIFSFVLIAAVVLATAAMMKIRPIAVIERPGSLLWVSLAESALVIAVILGWWLGFPSPPHSTETVIVLALLFVFLPIGSIAFSAALLSFTIYETRQIPSIHRRSATVPLAIAGVAMLVLLLLLVPNARPAAGADLPSQVVIKPTGARVALLAADGLTRDIFAARSEPLPHLVAFTDSPGGSAPAKWATVGTGTPPELHGVRSVEAVRFAGSRFLLQAISSADFVLTDVGGALRLTRRQPLPPTARERDYVWEILSTRGVESRAINWWATSDLRQPAIHVISQESIYAAAAQSGGTTPLHLALGIDDAALRAMSKDGRLRFLTAYFPALDIVLNRLELEGSIKLAASVRALEQFDTAIRELREAEWTVILVGSDFVASTRPLGQPAAAIDIAPTILDLFGFPASHEMRGRSLLTGSTQTRIRTYGSRRTAGQARVDEDYYEKLRSLGYVR